jgi:hypothetical protein
MPYDAVLELKSYMEEFAASKKPSRAEYIDLMRRFRMAIEHKELDQKYKTLYFYCNWVMHPGIAKNRYGFEMLTEIDSAIFGNSNVAVTEALAGVLKALALGELHDEIFRMLDELGIDKVALKNDWPGFQKALLHDLLNREVSLPDPLPSKGMAFEAREAMKQDRIAKGVREDLAVTKFYLDFHPTGHPGRPAGYYFNVVLHESGKVQLNGHLL